MPVMSEQEHAISIAEYEATFGPVQHYLSLESIADNIYQAAGLIALEREDADLILLQPNVEQRFYESDGEDYPAFVVLEITEMANG